MGLSLEILPDPCYAFTNQYGVDAMLPKTRDVKFTYEDYLLFPDDGKRHELIDGEHYMTPVPSMNTTVLPSTGLLTLSSRP